jgi:hypothetical protein
MTEQGYAQGAVNFKNLIPARLVSAFSPIQPRFSPVVVAAIACAT